MIGKRSGRGLTRIDDEWSMALWWLPVETILSMGLMRRMSLGAYVRNAGSISS
jgi:hypothetical protein